MTNIGKLLKLVYLTLNDELIKKLETLHLFVPGDTTSCNLEAASMAFLCGYLIKKIEEDVDCLQCLHSLKDHFPQKNNPLLELIYQQDRGKLMYPTKEFVSLVEHVVQVIIELLPSLPKENLNSILKLMLGAYLKTNVIFQCKEHNELVCKIIMDKLLPPILANYCMLERQKLQQHGNKKRKLLKLN